MGNGKINNSLQVGYIRRYVLTEGKENGLRVIELNNGVLRVLLNESKGLDIMQVWHKGVNMSFVSKNGFTSREIPFLQRFEGGMVYTCGLDSIGGREGFELHGSYHNTPAKIVAITEGEESLQVKAEIDNTGLFGKNLILQRTVTLRKGEISLEDTLINKGTKVEDYCLLYHINLGYPMLDEGVEIVADLESAIPRNEYSKKYLSSRGVFSAPIDNEEERCYFLNNKGNSISAVNKKLGKRFTVTYSKETLPCLVQWNSPASQDYALGLEPATCFLDDQFKYNQLEPNREAKFEIKLSFEEI